MKALSIGRDQACDIVVHDSTDVISRRHAILNISSSGKMTLVDQSRNGTYVNGIRISPNVPFPVTRKDIVSLAHVAKLDWNMVPNIASPMRYAIMGVIAVLLLICGYFAYQHYSTPDKPEKNVPEIVEKKDSTDEKTKKEPKDSIDNKNKTKKETPDSVNQKKKKENPKKDNKKDDKKAPSKEEPKDSTANNRRSIG